LTVNNKSVILIKVMTDICYILSSYIEVINYNKFCIANLFKNKKRKIEKHPFNKKRRIEKHPFNKKRKIEKHPFNKKRRIEKHPFDKYSSNEKENLELFYLLKRGLK